MYMSKLKRKLRSSAASLGQRLHNGNGKSHTVSLPGVEEKHSLATDLTLKRRGFLETVNEHEEQAHGSPTDSTDEEVSHTKSKRLKKFISLESVVFKRPTSFRRRVTRSFTSLPRARWETESILDETEGNRPYGKFTPIAETQMAVSATASPDDVDAAHSCNPSDSESDQQCSGDTRMDQRSSDTDPTGEGSLEADKTCQQEHCSSSSGAGLTEELETAQSQAGTSSQVPLTRKSSRRLSLTAGFELPRFRKRKLEKENDGEDNLSICSLDVSSTSAVKRKSKRSLLRVSASLINLVSPSRNKNENCGFKVPNSPLRPLPTASPYKPPRPSPAKRRVQLSWVDSFGSCGDDDKCVTSALSHHEIKRQEAIYELYQGERDMLEDLTNITKFYRDPLLKLGLISQSEAHTFFGNIESLWPVHEELINRLHEQRKPDGRTENIGQHIHDWADRLSVYVQYCANQIRAKAMFDEKKNEPAIDDFLQRCLASPFSRKLDLWTLLDGARGRFVKYPLLVRAILKYTQNNDDVYHLEKALERLEKIIKKADEETGVAKCEHSKSCLVYLFEDQKIPEIEQSTALLCSGCMKNTKGSKLFVFLFDRAVVVTRSTQQQGRQMYQVYRQPIPVSELLVEDLPDGEVKLGSFRNAFGQGNQMAKNLIRISFRDREKGQAHTLLANDEHDKRQWMQAFLKVASCVEQVADSSKTKV